MKRLIAIVALAAMSVTMPAVPSAAAAPSPLPRVTVTSTSMTANGVTFIPRGANYLRMAGDRITTFEVGEYDPARAEAMFRSLEDDDYNSNRVFIAQGDWVSRGVGGLLAQTTPFNPLYLDNVVDYVRRGARHGVYTSLVLQDIPTNCYFYTVVQGGTKCSTDYTIPNVYGVNAMFMDPGYVAAKAEYMELFAAEMRARLGADEAAILSYSSDNEATFDAGQAPFTNWDSSTVTVVGQSFRMNVAAERQEAADRAFVNYAILVKDGLRRGSPDANFTIGFYTNYAVNKVGFDGFVYCGTCNPTPNYKDTRYPARVSKVLTIVDLPELHFYPRPLEWAMVPGTGNYTVAKDLATVEVTAAAMGSKPWTIGEFGAFKSHYATSAQAAAAIRSARVAACRLGADGFQFWTFDTAEQADLYTLVQDGEIINQGLATSLNPNPCVR